MSFGEKKPNTFLLGGTEITEESRKNRPNRKKSQIQEKRFAGRIGSRLMPNSGATPWKNAKGDMRDALFVWEMKECEGKRIVLDESTIRTAWRHACGDLKWPAIGITMHRLHEELPKDWVAVPLDVFEEILERARDKSGD